MLFVDQSEFGRENVSDGGRLLLPTPEARIFSTMNVPPADALKSPWRYSPLKFLVKQNTTVAGLEKAGTCATYLDIAKQAIIACELEGRDWAEVLTKTS